MSWVIHFPSSSMFFRKLHKLHVIVVFKPHLYLIESKDAIKLPCAKFWKIARAAANVQRIEIPVLFTYFTLGIFVYIIIHYN